MNRAVFLDRDGTINKDVGYLHEKEKFEYIEGAVEGLKALQDMGYLLVIVTNQSGIARGYFTEKEYLEFEQWIEDDLEAKGIYVSGRYYCPHLVEAVIPRYRIMCQCRKPGCELFYKAARDLEIDLDRSISIGDRLRDMCICKESGAHGILLGSKETVPAGIDNITLCENWSEVADYFNVGYHDN